jgi:hypothetical protein
MSSKEDCGYTVKGLARYGGVLRNHQVQVQWRYRWWEGGRGS